MWRWLVRVYVGFIVFGFLLFVSGALLINGVRWLLRFGLIVPSQWIHDHVLLTMFLLGLTIGQLVLGSNFTGRGWFRRKGGITYEGFRLEKIKPWIWIIVSPVLLLGTIAWVLEQSESGSLTNVTFLGFYRTFLMPNCSDSQLSANDSCTMQLLFVGTWTASVGYSIAPAVRKRASRLLRVGSGKHETKIQNAKS